MKIDICVATKNSFYTLPKLLNSIKPQLVELESRVLIADGSSTDNTLKFLRQFSFCKIISYSDKSPEEAINKLIRFEPTNLKIVVGSDDWLSDNYISAFKEEAENLKSQGINKFVLIPKFYKNIGRNFLKINFPIPIIFLNFIGIGRGIGWGIFQEDGDLPLLDENLQIASDYDYLLSCLRNKFHFKYITCKYFHLKNGRSSKNWKTGLREEKMIGLKYSNNNLSKIFINILFLFKLSYKTLNSYICKTKLSL